MRKLKRPEGDVIEEGVAYSIHFFDNGKCVGRDHDFSDYTGRFCFKFRKISMDASPLLRRGKATVMAENTEIDRKTTRWYIEKTAPKWLLALYLEAMGADHA